MNNYLKITALNSNRNRIAGNRRLLSYYDEEPTISRIDNWKLVNQSIAQLTSVEEMITSARISLELYCTDVGYCDLLRVINEWVV
jgi:hypothetical protein